jgi:hypothetical protein
MQAGINLMSNTIYLKGPSQNVIRSTSMQNIEDETQDEEEQLSEIDELLKVQRCVLF